MYELQIFGNASIICFTRDIVIGLKSTCSCISLLKLRSDCGAE